MAKKGGDKLREALEIFAKGYIEELGNLMRSEDRVASGKLIRSLETKVIKTAFGTEYTIVVSGEDYIKYVDQGRRPGKRPPIQKIVEWVDIRGISRKAAYPIAKKIGEYGIKPTNILERSLRRVVKESNIRKMEEGMRDWVDEMVDDLLLNISKNGNITVRK